MRRSLQWALGAVLVLSAAAWWAGEAPSAVQPIERRVAAAAAAVEQALPRQFAVEAPATPLPARLDRVGIELARRDIFMPTVVPAAPEPVQPVRTAPPPPPPAAPLAPPVTYRYLGSMVAPAGERLTLLARGDDVVPIAAGLRLPEGYVVDAVGDDAVRLVYPSLGTVVLVPIPQAPN